MTGPEHYRKAEELVAHSHDPGRIPTDQRPSPEDVAMAQVHAILALAAAVGGLADHE